MTYFIIVLLAFCFGLLAFFLLSAVTLGAALLFWGGKNKEVVYATKNDELGTERGKIFLATGKREKTTSL